SEILVHLYEELGMHAIHRLNGEFAFVLWDAKRRVMFAARDRFGIKPLLHTTVGDTLYVASEAKALFAAGVPARWDAEAVLETCYVPTANRTLFRGVHNIPPGAFLRATAAGTSIHTYWDLDFSHCDEPSLSAADAVAGVRERLDAAVRRRLRADVP